jgi:L-ascorbate metabolism protein UlaG (beta-lactamase superfamily)
MTIWDALELCEQVRPRTAIPVHYEGWSHFAEGREAVERAISAAPEEIRRSFRLLPPGAGVEVGA